jgi:hypothetical protein
MISIQRRPTLAISLLTMLILLNVPATIDDPDNGWLLIAAGSAALLACNVSNGPLLMRKLRSGRLCWMFWSVLILNAAAAGLLGLTPGQFLATVGCTATVFISICSILEERSRRPTAV